MITVEGLTYAYPQLYKAGMRHAGNKFFTFALITSISGFAVGCSSPRSEQSAVAEQNWASLELRGIANNLGTEFTPQVVTLNNGLNLNIYNYLPGEIEIKPGLLNYTNFVVTNLNSLEAIKASVLDWKGNDPDTMIFKGYTNNSAFVFMGGNQYQSTNIYSPCYTVGPNSENTTYKSTVSVLDINKFPAVNYDVNDPRQLSLCFGSEVVQTLFTVNSELHKQAGHEPAREGYTNMISLIVQMLLYNNNYTYDDYLRIHQNSYGELYTSKGTYIIQYPIPTQKLFEDVKTALAGEILLEYHPKSSGSHKKGYAQYKYKPKSR